MTRAFKKLTLIFFLSFQMSPGLFSASADTMVGPFVKQGQPLVEFIEFVSQTVNKTFTMKSGLIKKDEKIDLYLRKKISIHKLWNIFLTILGGHGYTLVKNINGYNIISTRDIRYQNIKLYDLNDGRSKYPHNDQYIMAFYTMTYPLNNPIMRSVRSTMSRYARIVAFDDQKSLLITEKGNKIKQLIEIIKYNDSAYFYSQYLSSKKEKIKDLEKENSKLGRKLNKTCQQGKK